MNTKPKIIHFQKIGSTAEGYLSVAHDYESIGFEVRRVFWTYETPTEISRGRHAHYESEMVIVAVHGKIKVTARTIEGDVYDFELSDPNLGLFVPKLCWHEMFYSKDAVQLVLCSTSYNESDYIRSKDAFEMMLRENQNK